MIPTFLVVGLIAGAFAFPRIRQLVLGIVAASVLVTVGFTIWGDVSDVAGALGTLGLTFANLAIGAAVGWGISPAFRRGGWSASRQ